MAITNYHPISLLCIISKVVEIIIFNITIEFPSNSFTPYQFSFLPGRSTLLLFINKLIEAKHSNKSVILSIWISRRPLTQLFILRLKYIA